MSRATRAEALPPVSVTAVPPTLTWCDAFTVRVEAVMPETSGCPPTVTVAAPLAPIVATPPTKVLSVPSNWSRLSSRSLALVPSAPAMDIWLFTVANWAAVELAWLMSASSESDVLAAIEAIEVDIECSVDVTTLRRSAAARCAPRSRPGSSRPSPHDDQNAPSWADRPVSQGSPSTPCSELSAAAVVSAALPRAVLVAHPGVEDGVVAAGGRGDGDAAERFWLALVVYSPTGAGESSACWAVCRV